MVKRILLYLIYLSTPLQAQDMPSLQAWVAELSGDTWSQAPGLIGNFAVTASNPDQQSAWDALLSTETGCSFPQYMPSSALRFMQSMNPKSEMDVMQPSYLAQLPLQLILQDNGTSFAASAVFQAQPISLGNWAIPKARWNSRDRFQQWLTKKLGYDAVVVAVRGNWLLAALLTKRSELGQGLLLSDSQSQWVIPAKKGQGGAFLQLAQLEGCHALLEVLVTRNNNSALPGMKILFEARQ
jgi:hypothetical protein